MATATPHRSGTKLGKYRLERKLGKGSFASVWKARDTVEKRPVALKIAFPELVEEWGREALEHEARIAAGLSHPNIVGIRNADWVGPYFVIATDLAVRSLSDSPGVPRSGPIALQVIRAVVAGLAYAHERKILHRDVKPENILIFSDRRAALCDFGVSRFARAATQTYTEAGTLGYMAPEQAYGRPKLCSDVFSVGLIAYEALTGYLPTWPFDWPPERYRRFRERAPEPVQRVLRKAASFEPEQRYADAIVMHRALARALDKAVRSSGRRPARRRKRANGPPPSALKLEAQLFRKSHGTQLGMRFNCFRCDGPISEAMAFCPWCGTGDNSFRDVTRHPLICPECERGVEPEWTSCPWCYTGRFEGNGRAPRRDRSAVRRCSKRDCAGELRPFMRYCPVCKTKPRRVWSDPTLKERCPRCRWPVSRASWRYCPWCGRREPKAGTFPRSELRR